MGKLRNSKNEYGTKATNLKLPKLNSYKSA